MYLDSSITRGICCGMLALLAWGCENNGSNQQSNNTNHTNNQTDMTTSDMPDMTDETPDLPPKPKKLLASKTPRVKFKGGVRWSNDLKRALSLSDAQFCKELSQYDCVKTVHRITLGGVEPYSLGIDKPVEIAPVTAPIAIDRVALYACYQRANLDINGPDAPVVFTSLKKGERPSTEAMQSTAKTLYDRILRRDATDEEVKVLVDFAAEVEKDSQEPLIDWAMFSCFMVATSSEALFY